MYIEFYDWKLARKPSIEPSEPINIFKLAQWPVHKPGRSMKMICAGNGAELLIFDYRIGLSREISAENTSSSPPEIASERMDTI